MRRFDGCEEPEARAVGLRVLVCLMLEALTAALAVRSAELLDDRLGGSITTTVCPALKRALVFTPFHCATCEVLTR